MPVHGSRYNGVLMTEQDFYVLLVLAEGPLHGYGIARKAEKLSEQRVRLKVGSLYGLLDRLVAEGLVKSDRQEIHNDRARRYYRLTVEGEAALDADVQRQLANASVAS